MAMIKHINWIFAFIAMLIIAGTLASALATPASTAPLFIAKAEVDGTEVYQYSTNKLSLERDAEFEVELELRAYADAEDIEIEAFISGYEYNDFERISDTTHIFDVEKDTTYKKTLKLSLPDNVEQDDYKLRILISDRNSMASVFEYRIQVDTDRHNLKISDVTFSPGLKIKQGQALLSTVRVENQGDKNEDDVKVTIAMPELGLSASDYIDEVEENDEAESEEIYLRMPSDAKPGVYTLLVKVEYDKEHEKEEASGLIEIAANEALQGAEEESDGKEDAAEVIYSNQTLSPEEFSLVMESNQPVTDDRVDADGATSAQAKIKNWLELALVFLIVILAVVGLIVGFTSIRK
jgi:hypothetical protein